MFDSRVVGIIKYDFKLLTKNTSYKTIEKTVYSLFANCFIFAQIKADKGKWIHQKDTQ